MTEPGKDRLPVNIGSGMEVDKTRNCMTCKLGYNTLQMINRLLANGVSYREITATLVQEQHEGRIRKAPSYHSVVNHCKNHTRYKEKVIREALDRRAAQSKMDMDSDAMSILTTMGIIEVVAKKGFQGMVEGQTTPTINETIQATKLLREWEKDADQDVDVAKMQHQMNSILQAVREIVPEEFWTPMMDRAEALLNAGS